ncbi:MAG: hypothetical protein ACRDV2_03785 [Actinomycetes bacterium]
MTRSRSATPSALKQQVASARPARAALLTLRDHIRTRCHSSWCFG